MVSSLEFFLIILITIYWKLEDGWDYLFNRKKYDLNKKYGRYL